jgi:hypothetical protein
LSSNSITSSMAAQVSGLLSKVLSSQAFSIIAFKFSEDTSLKFTSKIRIIQRCEP